MGICCLGNICNIFVQVMQLVFFFYGNFDVYNFYFVKVFLCSFNGKLQLFVEVINDGMSCGKGWYFKYLRSISVGIEVNCVVLYCNYLFVYC